MGRLKYCVALALVAGILGVYSILNRDEKRDINRVDFQTTYEESTRRASELEKEVKKFEQQLKDNPILLVIDSVPNWKDLK